MRFCLVGVLNTLIDLGLYYLLTRYLGFSGEYIFIAKGVSASIATLNSFVCNRLWTFEKAGAWGWHELAKFYATIGSGILINMMVHFVDVTFLGINDLASSAIATGLTAVWGFTLAKYVVFK